MGPEKWHFSLLNLANSTYRLYASSWRWHCSLHVAACWLGKGMGKEVVIFAAGRSVLALAGRGGAGGPYYEKMRELKVDWHSLLKASKPLGLKIVA